MSLSVIILAAGKGTRMKSSLPKVLHAVAHKPMIQHVIDTAISLKADKIHVVYGHGGEQLIEQLQPQYPDLQWIHQEEQLGTGHAVQQAMPLIQPEENVLILYGDVPLVTQDSLTALFTAYQKNNEFALMTATFADPTGYGRIVRQNGDVQAIVEQKDASQEVLAIQEINTGVMLVQGKKLLNWLSELRAENAQKEYYLTDIVAMAVQEGCNIQTSEPHQVCEIMGANDKIQLAQLEQDYQRRLVQELMSNGASVRDPQRVDIRGEVTIGQDVEIDVNVILEGRVHLGDHVKIGANCILKDCEIGEGTEIHPFSMIDSSIVHQYCQIGPYARLRPETTLQDKAKVGNFVEVKKSTLGTGAKANHLAYIGDAEVGEKVNIGAGTITCNYDGANKSKTVIEAGAFIGSNSSLVAPVSIGKNATVGAGSTVTKSVGDEELVIARGKQRHIQNWQRPVKKKG
ncbi:bifunctional UDP-N-acetylglucosamine diphosphorylase/glucosamine-1-phosphate N-acetyltransferase GlmU [Algicola sagamiensis]|uniref:bifunctional UDP-N-acetylglucosamine diphosphorylase/glucosamine-1-phosphate N-acetyltransferase GlmU n=1 Tax=Algicola sagamiensis TaxID=163869 RepID=UPI000380228D|nr:bifunctional UDP-N-acetylglucosamine diphosphorylase/glucosamine-1-phosphate N-acetyltransferase GlmU [Algicola sagamiensis]